MDQQIQVALNMLNDKLAGKFPYKLYLAQASEIDFLEKNAQFMTKEQFSILTENIKKDHALSSMPLCYLQENKRLLVLSGNHRIKAAIAAGVAEFLVLLIDTPLTEDRRIAIQLSHNAIFGQSDEQILKELWKSINDLEAKIYSGLSTEMIQKLESAQFMTISEQRLVFKEVSLLFLPEEIESMTTICDGILAAASKKTVFAGRITEYNEILDGIITAKQGQKIINTTLAFFAMAKVVREYLEEKTASLQEAMEDGAEDTVVFILGGTRKRISKNTAKALRKRLKEEADAGRDLDTALSSLAKTAQH